MTAPIASRSCVINLWDDYTEDGEGPQSTFAYVESEEIDAATQKELLCNLEARLQAWAFAYDQDITTRMEMFDSLQAYPNLAGTDHEGLAYKRWQLFIDGLSHVGRENFIAHLEKVPVEQKGWQVRLVSES